GKPGSWERGRAVLLLVLLLAVIAGGQTARARRAAAVAGQADPQATTDFDAAPPKQAELPMPAPASSSGSGAVVAVIPSRTFVHLDKRHRPVQAMTNTGLAPRAGDQFFVEDGAGDRPADTGTMHAVLASAAARDW